MYEGWERSKIWLAFHDSIGDLERLVGLVLLNIFIDLIDVELVV
jgi:hypothetical protein